MQALKGAPLFDRLSRKALTELARVPDDLEVEPGKVLCKEREIGQEFFVIVDGGKGHAEGRRVGPQPSHRSVR